MKEIKNWVRRFEKEEKSLFFHNIHEKELMFIINEYLYRDLEIFERNVGRNIEENTSPL